MKVVKRRHGFSVASQIRGLRACSHQESSLVQTKGSDVRKCKTSALIVHMQPHQRKIRKSSLWPEFLKNIRLECHKYVF